MADLEQFLKMLRRMQADLRDIKDTQREHPRRLGHIELNTAQQNVADGAFAKLRRAPESAH